MDSMKIEPILEPIFYHSDWWS